MTVTFKFQLFPIFFLFFLSTMPGYSQFSIDHINEIPRLKNGPTYVAMKDTASPIAQAYKEVFKQYWTCSKVTFIQYKDILKYMSADASYFTIGGYTTTSTFEHMTGTGLVKQGLSYDNTHLYFELWVCEPKALEKWQKRTKKKDELPDKVKQVIGRVELFTDFPSLSFPDKLYKADYDGDGHIRNWGLGYLKTDLQVLMSLLEKGAERTLYKGSTSPKQLKALKKQTLYIPDYVLISFNKFNGNETKRHKESELLGDYKLPYKLIGNDELNKKIMEDTEPFYYLVYIKSSTDKYVSVYNSQTGEQIYTDYTPISYNIKDKDFEKLADAIGGK